MFSTTAVVCTWYATPGNIVHKYFCIFVSGTRFDAYSSEYVTDPTSEWDDPYDRIIVDPSGTKVSSTTVLTASVRFPKIGKS